MIIPGLTVAMTEKKGLGVYTEYKIEAGTIIEKAPVVVMTAEERKLLDQTRLHDYIFEWGVNKDQCGMALGYIAVYNHSYESNCEYEMDYTAAMITIKAVHDIPAGEEILINYNGDWNDRKPVWFDVK